MNDDINDFLPSIINPRTVRKQNLSLTQNSVASRYSLSLKRNNGLSRNLNQTFPVQKQLNNKSLNHLRSPSSFDSKNAFIPKLKEHLSKYDERNKENNNSDQNASGTIVATRGLALLSDNELANASTIDLLSLGDLNDSGEQPRLNSNDAYFYAPVESKIVTNRVANGRASVNFSIFEDLTNNPNFEDVQCNNSITISSSAKLNECDADETLAYNLNEESHISISFSVNNCESVDVTTKNTNIKKISLSHKDNNINVDCELVGCVSLSTDSEFDENMNVTSPKAHKRPSVTVSLEIKKKKLTTEDAIENSKVLILKTDAVEKLSHVIVQPPNYKLVKRHILDINKFQSCRKTPVIRQAKNGKNGTCEGGDNLRQISIDPFLAKGIRDQKETRRDAETEDCVVLVSDDDDADEMSKNSGVADATKCDRVGRVAYRSDLKGNALSPRPGRGLSGRPDTASPRRQEVKASSSDAPHSPSIRGRNESVSSHSPRKNTETIQFNLIGKPRSSRTPAGSARRVPHFKIVAGTHFAVDAFSYGDIPNVKHYFLTHFHSDHYSGLKKSFNKLLYCSKITGDLCVSRIGVSPKCIHVLTLDNTIRIEGVEVTAVDANHCPGAIMLIFGLPNGKTILHTGDFRASPTMESYPLFWNKDIHTIYLDTTYCNARYDFPTQDQSLEMALFLLRQKKMALEKAGKKFSSVLIVCGTYTIGKEKFFLGMARRVGCAVWACPEKDKVLQAVEGRCFSHAPPHSCQLHVVPMRDLSHEKLKNYLDSLNGAFTEVVAFKPSGWENGKNTTVEKDMVTIHGIPYSEHSSFSELIRFVKFLKPKQVVPTVDISGGIKSVQKYFPCPLVYKEESVNQSKVTDYFSIQGRPQAAAVT